jgi:DNA-directed RNA polymerase specialized sigma24 family protein
MESVRGGQLGELLAQARQGSQEAEESLFKILTVRFRLIATRYVGTERGHDVAQDACRVVLARYRTEEYSRSFEAWCHGVLRMTLLSHIQKESRRAGKELSLDYEVPSPHGNPGNPRLMEALLGCVRDMMAKSRAYVRILNLTYQGFKTAEICERLGINRNHYYVSLSRGRGMLRECLRRKGFAP